MGAFFNLMKSGGQGKLFIISKLQIRLIKYCQSLKFKNLRSSYREIFLNPAANFINQYEFATCTDKMKYTVMVSLVFISAVITMARIPLKKYHRGQ